MRSPIINRNSFESSERVVFLKNGLPVKEVTTSVSIKKQSARKGKTMVVHPTIPFSQFLVYSSSGKDAPAVKRSLVETLEAINNTTIAVKYIAFFKENCNEFMTINTPLTKLVQDWFKVKVGIAKRFTKEFTASDIIRKVNNTTYVVNPYVMWYFGLSNDKHYYLQSHWTYKSDEEIVKWDLITEQEQHEFNNQVISSLDSQTKNVSETYSDSEKAYDAEKGLLQSEIERLTKAGSSKVSELIYTFVLDTNKNGNIGSVEAFKVAITMLTNDNVVRQFYSWYKSQLKAGKLDELLQFDFQYKNRKKITAFLLSLGAEVDKQQNKKKKEK